jgi:Flp pilus assembly protein TadG
MDILIWLSQFVRTIGRNERGSTVTLIAAAAVPLVAFVGLSIDTARGYLLKQRIGFALDGAVLAAAATALDADVNTVGQKFFNANFPSDFMGVGTVTPTFTLSSDNTTVTGDVTADMPTALMAVVGIDDVGVGANAAALRQTRGLELVIALDNTGSMGGYIDDLEDATGELLDVLYGTRETVDNLWIGLIPFDTRVNLKNYSSLVSFTPSNANRVCANPRAGHQTDDATPATSAFSSQYTQWSYGCEATPALALTAERSTLDTTLSNMDDDGYTRVDVATAWAFRMLSPDWTGLWGNPDLPKPYSEPLMDKAVIIMTDGDNKPKDGTPTATTNTRLASTCANMKTNGIIVYTIQFRTTSSSLETLLTNCATDPTHYYHAGTDDLDDVFTEIGNKLSNLRLLN